MTTQADTSTRSENKHKMTQLELVKSARNHAVEMMLEVMEIPTSADAGYRLHFVEATIDAFIGAASEAIQYSGTIDYVTTDELIETVNVLDERLQSSTKRGHPSLLAPTVVLEMARLETAAEITQA